MASGSIAAASTPASSPDSLKYNRVTGTPHFSRQASGHSSGTPSEVSETFERDLTTFQLRLYVPLRRQRRRGVAHELLCLLGIGAEAIEQVAVSRTRGGLGDADGPGVFGFLINLTKMKE